MLEETLLILLWLLLLLFVVVVVLVEWEGEEKLQENGFFFVFKVYETVSCI